MNKSISYTVVGDDARPESTQILRNYRYYIGYTWIQRGYHTACLSQHTENLKTSCGSAGGRRARLRRTIEKPHRALLGRRRLKWLSGCTCLAPRALACPMKLHERPRQRRSVSHPGMASDRSTMRQGPRLATRRLPWLSLLVSTEGQPLLEQGEAGHC